MTSKQKAIWLMVISTLSMSIMQLFVKLTSGRIPTMEQVFVRNLVTLFVGAFLLIKRGTPALGHKGNRLALFARSLLGYLGVVGYFYATRHMNVADASLLHRSSPFFVIIFSALFLKNRLKWVQLAALILAFTGSVLVINPSFNVDVVPALIGLGSAAGAGGAYTVINHLKGKESNETIIFCFSLFSCVFSLLFVGDFVVPTGRELLLLLGIGVFAGIGQIALTQAYKMTEPGSVSIINYSGILFSAVFGFAFLDEVLETRSILGILAIFTAALLLYFVKDSREIGKKKTA